MLQISAKDLGALAMGDFCRRCFWIGRHVKLPYQLPFAGVFYSIDGYTKSVVESYLARNGRLPEWLGGIGDVKEEIAKPVGFRAEKYGVALTGNPDAMFRRPDGSVAIVDYKTARRTAGQDALLPMYEIQVNGYAYIAESVGVGRVSGLYLVYFQPPAREEFGGAVAKRTTKAGFEMPFRPEIVEIKKDYARVEELMRKAAAIYKLGKPPGYTEGCEDCSRLKGLLDTVSGKA